MAEALFWQCSEVMISAMASQITGVSIVYSTICSGANQRKHQSSVSLAFVKGTHWWQVNSPHKGPVLGNMFPSIWWCHHETGDLMQDFICWQRATTADLYQTNSMSWYSMSSWLYQEGLSPIWMTCESGLHWSTCLLLMEAADGGFSLRETCYISTQYITICHMYTMLSQITWLFVQQLVHAYNKENIKAIHYWPFVRGIHRSPVDSPHKGPVILKAFPCRSILMLLIINIVWGQVMGIYWVQSGSYAPP